MNPVVQEAVLVGLARRLADKGSWGGETHVQKAAYLISELRALDFDFDFILYKHGPFSFELRDQLFAMRSDGLLEQVTPNPKYGPQLRATKRGQHLEGQFASSLGRYDDALDWITTALGNRNVRDLERLATAMWMTRKHPGASIETRAAALVEVKPHISRNDAVDAVQEIDRLLADTPAPAVA